ncbi:uncharacterized protein LAESUDRAFT_662657 [Laetiporus sulphureus 93-53]|uniref:Cyclosome subunit 5 n=1 Tax=Laetiporus sulphureus 93-53 TaxID=1314785 RepID=A0A165C2E7_9APHY|nr:uncharacterized protein LAESUDRAFT_662657 [Laetiporus sulphureus 93-53]KZT02078.1 hypothetical protein LAESUDRAFT_662657 [Laetiporus sulphureus 93-53]
MPNNNGRPEKRKRLEPSSSHSESESVASFAPLPPAVLLVSLPALLAQPPNHRFYLQSLTLSLSALRICLSMPALSPEIECRAWTGLAEIGMKVIGGGLSQNEEHMWAHGIEAEVEKAVSKGSIIAQKHPSLRAYMHHLALLQAQLSHWQQKSKFARTQIRKLLASFRPTDPPHVIYSAQLAYINLLTTPSPSLYATSVPGQVSFTPPSRSPQDIHAALNILEELETTSKKNEYKRVALLARVLRLRILVAASLWADVPTALKRAEEALGLSYEPKTTPKPHKVQFSTGAEGSTDSVEATFISFDSAFESAMVVHLLMMSVVYYTHIGDAPEASPRLSHLHSLLDSGALDKFPSGVVELPFDNGPPLIIEVTHPRVLFLLGFLVSATAKRDAVGRKPKRKVFASEGLTVWETEVKREISFSLWSGLGDIDEIEQRLARIKADLLCELIAVSTMRSEFDTAEKNIDILIAHTRTYNIFPRFAARIALHHAYLAHALGQSSRALQCYRVAAQVAESGSFVQHAARAGEAAMQIGLQHSRGDVDGGSCLDSQAGLRIAKICRGAGGILEAIGRVIEACLTTEILKAKQHLKQALAIATRAQDNHLRALILALIASHYFHTAGDHAREMLQTCEQLAAGLGAPATKGAPSNNGKGPKQEQPVAIGNAPLGLWIGERFLELYKRAGKESRVQKQMSVNAQLAKAVEDLARRARNPGEDSAS